jgi:hypothetical protein
MGNILKQDDFVGAGFKRIDDTLIEQHPPQVKWGKAVLDMSLKQRCRYFERIAMAMNHAAAQLQGERDELNKRCFQMEDKMKLMAQGVGVNNHMLASEVTRLNADRQEMLKTVARLNAENRALKKKLADAGLE